jgi:hypothetical protein
MLLAFIEEVVRVDHASRPRQSAATPGIGRHDSPTDRLWLGSGMPPSAHSLGSAAQRESTMIISLTHVLASEWGLIGSEGTHLSDD